MNRTGPASVRAVAFVVATAAVLLGACGDDTRSNDADATRVPSAGAEPTRLDRLPEGTPLDPGTYALSARGHPDLPRVVLDVPRGFEGGGDFLMASGQSLAALAYWTVAGVYDDPCTKRSRRSAGRTVEDLAEILASQPMLSPSEPAAVQVGDREGLYLEMRVPEIDFQECAEDDVAFWSSVPAGDLYSATAGALVRVWIVDLDGTRVVLNTYTEPGASTEQVDGLDDVVASARFVRS